METAINDSLLKPRFITPFDAATWQLLHLADDRGYHRVTLPALQRGAVWRPRQVEMLWDSLIRGFPIGSFLLAPYGKHDPEQGARAGRYTTQNNEADLSHADGQQCYHLLDGQQRWNAITLGFVNIWEPNPVVQANLDALWVDLDEPQGITDGREFIFRVVTRSHPWGYQLNDPSKRLSAQHRREALEAYEKAYKAVHKTSSAGHFRPGNVPLKHAWPWEASAPVPFVFIVDAARAGIGDIDIWAAVGQSIECLSYWPVRNSPDSHFERLRMWTGKVDKCLKSPGTHMERLLRGVKYNLGIMEKKLYQIPILILPPETMGTSNNIDIAQQPDRLETLFIRINSEGTRLEGEELNYSILKSIYPRAEKLVEGPGPDVKGLSTGLMPPSRLVTFVSRLALARSDDGKFTKAPPPELNVARFRRLIHSHDSAFRERLREYIGLDASGTPEPGGRDAAALLNQAKALLTFPSKGNAEDHRLPPVLVTDLARRSQDAFFVLLVWLDRMTEVEQKIEDLSEDEKRRIVGTITTLGWFALKPDKCLNALWKRLTDSNPQDFFSAGVLRKCLDLTDRREMPLIPPLPPACLKAAVNALLKPLPRFESGFWQSEWNWWKNFADLVSNILMLTDFCCVHATRSRSSSWITGCPWHSSFR